MLDIFSQLEKLKKKRNAVILAHYYQDPDIQDASDFMGDSLALAQYAAKTDADVILFCGVHFMCETAKILNPKKRVILPDMDAGCSLADSAPPQKFKAWVNSHPDHTVITYINCSAGVKAASDIICTSSNAEKIFIPLPSNDGCACNECPHMRLNTIEKMLAALEKMEPEISLSKEVRLQALAPLEKMLALS